MSDSQRIFGNSNVQAGRDIVCISDYKPRSIHFYEQDIKDIIDLFDKSFYNLELNEVYFEPSNLLEYNYIEKEKKNKLNSLSEEYFNYILDEHLQYFYKINDFLSDPKNIDLLKKYKKTVREINFKIQTIRPNFSSFDEILGVLYDGLSQKDTYEGAQNRDLYILFFNFMYWNCDIGRKR